MAFLELEKNLKLALAARPIFKIEQKQSGAPETRAILKIKNRLCFEHKKAFYASNIESND